MHKAYVMISFHSAFCTKTLYKDSVQDSATSRLYTTPGGKTPEVEAITS